MKHNSVGVHAIYYSVLRAFLAFAYSIGLPPRHKS